MEKRILAWDGCTNVRDLGGLSALEGLNIDSYLRMGGVSQDDLAAVRKRLLG